MQGAQRLQRRSQRPAVKARARDAPRTARGFAAVGFCWLCSLAHQPLSEREGPGEEPWRRDREGHTLWGLPVGCPGALHGGVLGARVELVLQRML